jgi:hypothetical protein
VFIIFCQLALEINLDHVLGSYRIFAENFDKVDATKSVNGRSRIPLGKIVLDDKLPLMKVPVRMLLAALLLSIGSLTPLEPGKTSLAISQSSNCCAGMHTGGCHGCLTNTGETSSGFGSTCCPTGSACFALYFIKAEPFLARIHLIGAIGVRDDHATTLTQRPPVPPPRSVVS